MNKDNIYIMLDIDGVLATVKQWNLTNQSKSWLHKYDVYPFDKKCVEMFNNILEITNANIILSSDWKHHYNLTELDDIFKLNGVIKSPIDTTKHILKGNNIQEIRAKEIITYINENNIEYYIAIDDLDLYTWIDENNFLFCPNVNEGIKQSGLIEKFYKKINI